ncbi:MAG: nuclear transport factor 2 family protein [Alphaproteobacteria bacterium]
MTPEQALRAYCDAFAAHDAERVIAVFAPGALYELPLVRPRMVGAVEMRAGLARAFAVMTACTITLAHVHETGSTALAEGTMAVRLAREPGRASLPFALAGVVDGGRLRRLSVYLDARPYRPWSDGPVLALDSAP